MGAQGMGYRLSRLLMTSRRVPPQDLEYITQGKLLPGLLIIHRIAVYKYLFME